MKSEWPSGGGVPERDGRSGQPRKRRGAPATEVAGMTVDVVGRGDELADGYRPLAGRRHRGGNWSIPGIPGPT
jgi:hypothetical protein